MDEVRKLGLYNDKQLFDINAVRMHLQVTKLSDIADAAGHRITEEAYKGQKLSDRYSRLKWPRQPVITTKQRNLWTSTLDAAFTSSGVVLKQSLGAWTRPPTQVWRNFYNPGTKQVVTLTTVGTAIHFTEYTVHQHARRYVEAVPVATASTYIDLEAVDWNIMIPATVKPTRTQTALTTFHSHVSVLSEEANTVTTFKEYLQTIPEHEQCLLMHVEFVPGGEDTLKHCLQHDKLLKIGTDGSFNRRLPLGGY
jgi:hypothetical protein